MAASLLSGVDRWVSMQLQDRVLETSSLQGVGRQHFGCERALAQVLAAAQTLGAEACNRRCCNGSGIHFEKHAHLQ